MYGRRSRPEDQGDIQALGEEVSHDASNFQSFLLTSSPNHPPSPSREAADEGYHEWCGHVYDARGRSADDGDVRIISELRQLRVVVLEDTEGERET